MLPSFHKRSLLLLFFVCFVLTVALKVTVVSEASNEPVRWTTFARSIFTNSNSLLAAEGKVSPQVMADTTDGKNASILILLADQADVSAAYDIKDHDARGWFVYNTLIEHAKSTQIGLRAFLDSRGVEYKSFWAANMLVAEADRSLAVQLAGRSDVARVDSNRPTRWIEDEKIAKTRVDGGRTDSPDTIEWGVQNVNAPGVWELGSNGSGIVVGGLDTGIRWTHNAIKGKYRGWDGTTANHNYNWHDAIHSGGGVCGANTLAPCDDSGHGSHTVGTMVGDDGAGNQVGVAPGAKWIGCRNMNVGDGTPASYSECFQFMIAPTDLAGNNANPALRPHVLNNSWGCPAVEGCTTRAELETIVNNTQAAGIFVQASAGNSGGAGCSSVSQALGIYDASFSAGAIDANNALAGFSSRGPSTFYNPNILKPNLSAPGVSVRSITSSGDAAYSFSSGTSMASPHVAGVVALLWSANPNLIGNIAATKSFLQNTANPGVSVTPEQTCGGTSSTQIPNNSFGYGRVDAMAAFIAAVPNFPIDGKVVSPDGLGLRNAVVSLTNSTGIRRTATTSSFGNFKFDNVISGKYLIGVSSKRYRFASRFVDITGSSLIVDFVGLQ